MPADLSAIVVRMMAKEPDRPIPGPRAEVAEALKPFFKKGSVSVDTTVPEAPRIGLPIADPALEATRPDPTWGRLILIDENQDESAVVAAGPAPGRSHPPGFWPMVAGALAFIAILLGAVVTYRVGFRRAIPPELTGETGPEIKPPPPQKKSQSNPEQPSLPDVASGSKDKMPAAGPSGSVTDAKDPIKPAGGTSASGTGNEPALTNPPPRVEVAANSGVGKTKTESPTPKKADPPAEHTSAAVPTGYRLSPWGESVDRAIRVWGSLLEIKAAARWFLAGCGWGPHRDDQPRHPGPRVRWREA